jgi:hypothetical protein
MSSLNIYQNINHDLIGAVMENRIDNDFTTEELLNNVDKLKIMTYLRASEDFPIFNSAQEDSVYYCPRDAKRKIAFSPKDEVVFKQRVSIAQKKKFMTLYYLANINLREQSI